MLETVIPQAGGKVMVVDGQNKGKVGKLIERTKKYIFFIIFIYFSTISYYNFSCVYIYIFSSC